MRVFFFKSPFVFLHRFILFLFCYFILFFIHLFFFLYLIIYLKNIYFFSIYYQINQFYNLPDTCAHMYTSTEEVTITSLADCSAMETVYSGFISDTCSDSFESICQAEYTDNPPFSCKEKVSPDFLTAFGKCATRSIYYNCFVYI